MALLKIYKTEDGKEHKVGPTSEARFLEENDSAQFVREEYIFTKSADVNEFMVKPTFELPDPLAKILENKKVKEKTSNNEFGYGIHEVQKGTDPNGNPIMETKQGWFKQEIEEEGVGVLKEPKVNYTHVDRDDVPSDVMEKHNNGVLDTYLSSIKNNEDPRENGVTTEMMIDVFQPTKEQKIKNDDDATKQVDEYVKIKNTPMPSVEPDANRITGETDISLMNPSDLNARVDNDLNEKRTSYFHTQEKNENSYAGKKYKEAESILQKRKKDTEEEYTDDDVKLLAAKLISRDLEEDYITKTIEQAIERSDKEDGTWGDIDKTDFQKELYEDIQEHKKTLSKVDKDGIPEYIMKHKRSLDTTIKLINNNEAWLSDNKVKLEEFNNKYVPKFKEIDDQLESDEFNGVTNIFQSLQSINKKIEGFVADGLNENSDPEDLKAYNALVTEYNETYNQNKDRLEKYRNLLSAREKLQFQYTQEKENKSFGETGDLNFQDALNEYNKINDKNNLLKQSYNKQLLHSKHDIENNGGDINDIPIIESALKRNNHNAALWGATLLKWGVNAVYSLEQLATDAPIYLGDLALKELGYDKEFSEMNDLEKVFSTAHTLWKGRSDKKREAFNEFNKELDSMVKEPPQWGDLGTDEGNWGEYIAYQLVNFAPQAAMLVTMPQSSLTILSSMAAGQKYVELSDKNKSGAELTSYQILGSMVAAAGAEYYSEKYTQALINKTWGKGAEVVARDGFMSGTKRFIRNMPMAAADRLGESGSEVMATIFGDNIPAILFQGDGSVGVFDNVAESAFNGLVMAEAMKIPSTFKYVVTPFMTPKDKDVITSKTKELLELEHQLASNKNISEGARTAIEKKILKINQEVGDVLYTTIDRVDDMTSEEKRTIMDATKEVTEENQIAKEIAQDQSIPIEARKQLIKESQDRINLSHKKRIDLMKDVKIRQDLEVTETAAKKIGTKTNVVNDRGDFVRRFRKSYPQSTEINPGLLDAYYDPNTNEMIINKTRAKEIGAVSVGSHELLHAIMRNSLRDKKSGRMSQEGEELVNNFLGSLSSQERAIIEKRIEDNYKYDSYEVGEDGVRKGVGEAKPFAEYGEEYLNSYVDAIRKGEIRTPESTFERMGEKIGDWFRTKKGFENIEFEGFESVRDFLRTYTSEVKSGQVSQRILDIAGPITRERTPNYKMAASKTSPNAFENAEIVNDLGLKGETAKIVERNKTIEERIIREGTRDKNGNIMPSARMQQELARNNLPRAFALARQAAGKANDLTLEEGLKMNDVAEWFGEYSLKLTELARTYRPIVKDKDGNDKRIPFGAYMNTLLPVKYSGILNKLKSKVQASSMAEETTAKEVGKISIPTEELSNNEVEGKKVALNTIGQNEVQQQLVNIVKDIPSLSKLRKYKDVKSELVAHNKPKKKSDRKPTGKLYPALEAVSAIFSVDPMRIIKEQDLDAIQRKAAQDAILKNTNEIIAMMPFGTTASGDATGVANTKLGIFYKKGQRTKMSATGTGKGLATQAKQNIDPTKFRELVGLVKGGRINNTSVDGAIRAVIVQVASIAANQAVRQTYGPETLPLKDGKASVMYSQTHSKADTPMLQEFGALSRQMREEIGEWTRNIKGKDSISKRFKLDVINMKVEGDRDVKGKKHYKNWKFTIENQYFPIAWVAYSGNSTGTSERIKDKDGNTIGRKTTGNLAYPNSKPLKQDLDDALESDVNFNGEGNWSEQEKKDLAIFLKARKLNDKTLFNKEEKAAIKRAFKKIWQTYDQMVEDNPDNLPYILAQLSSTSAHMKHFMRIGATHDFSTIDDGPTMEEHQNPASRFSKYLFNRLADRTLFDKNNNFDNAVKSYSQGPILRTDDLKLKGTREDGTEFNYADDAGNFMYPIFTGLFSPWVRYFNPDVNNNNGGFNPNRIKLEDGQTLAEDFGVGVDKKLLTPTVIAKQQELIFQIGTNQITKKQATKAINNLANLKIKDNIQASKTLNNAIAASRTFSEPKGITVLDFDDTLATTKSGVRARIPNPSGDPKPSRKVIFLAGGAGSGKSNVVNKLGLEDQGFKVVNSDISLEWLKKNSGLPENMNDLTKEQRSTLGKLQHQARGIARRKMMKYQGNADGVIVDGTGGSIKSMEKLVKEFEEKGYDVSMLFVDTSVDIALERNKARKERSLLDKIVKINHKSVQDNKDGFKKMFGNNFMEVNTDKLTREDPMPNKLINKVNEFVGGYEKVRLDAEQFASEGADILERGGEFDFSEFNVVVEGQTAPLFNKAMKLQGKYGSKDMFVLTARPAESAPHIHKFLKANGLNIPLKNITGLANSTPEAKALWIAEKVGEGYNDFYFADDAIQNVQAVDNMLEQFDVKRKVQQAKPQFSKSMNDQFNNILETVTSIEAEKRFSATKARKRGESKGKFRLFIPPSHEDFIGLLYNFMGKGEEGNKHRDFFEQNLIKPLNRAYREIDVAKQAIANDYKELNKQFSDVKEKLAKKTPDGDFTFQDAIRVYLWDKHGHDIPGLNKTDQKRLVDLVKSDAELQTYADALNVISKQETYINPTQGWEGGNIKIDLIDATGRVGRAEYFTEFNENADILFSTENLNKIEAAYGSSFRSALEDMLYRIKTGINRPKGQSATVNKFMNYLNGSVGAVMFFNMRSAILQQMSIVNYINFADNNIFAAAKAFANQKQYWKDWAFIFNSDMLKQRRGGLQTDINGAELAQAIGRSTNPTRSVIGYLLKLGFKPTQIGDNIAIATGGATFYRNRVNKYIKDGMSQKEAEAAAFTDFQDLTQSTQQSSRPDMSSQQQSMWIGKMVLNFQNITSQYNRIIKKSASDIYNRRITPPNSTQLQSDVSNLSRILYYGGIQNVIFYSLQTALFAVMFGDEDESNEKFLKKRERVINGTFDSILRGSGIYGVAVSTLKNMAIKWHEQRNKDYNKDESAVLMELLNFSPVVGIKARKLVNAEKTINYNENVISEMETFDADNPAWSAVTNYTEALTNFPANRLYQKSINLRNALDNDYEAWQRALFFSGYTTWSLGLEDTKKMQVIKETVKTKKKQASKIKKEEKRKEKLREEYPGKSDVEIQNIIKLKEKNKEVFDLNKREQVKILEANGLNPKDYSKEKDRVDAIMSLREKNESKIDSTLTAIKNYVPTKDEQRSIELFKMTKKDQINTLIGLGLSPKQIRSLKYEKDRVEKIMELQKKVKK